VRRERGVRDGRAVWRWGRRGRDGDGRGAAAAMMATAACRKLSSGRSVPEPLPLVPGRAHLSQGVPPLGLATAAKLLKSVGARSTGAACLMVQLSCSGS